jgi:phosphatidylserine decarboxylase
MLNRERLALKFSRDGLPSFLSALSCDRWHVPVAGTILKVVHIPGACFLQNDLEGYANIKPDTGKPGPGVTAPNSSQAYVCQVAI